MFSLWDYYEEETKRLVKNDLRSLSGSFRFLKKVCVR